MSKRFHFRLREHTDEQATRVMPNWRHRQDNIWPHLRCKCVYLCHCCTYICIRWLVHKFRDELVKNKTQICEMALSHGGGGRCMLKKSMSHSIFLVTKFGFTPVDTYTLKLTGTDPQKIPRYPSECHYMFNFTCNVLSVQQGSLEHFFSDTIILHLHITHVDTTFNTCQITGNMHLVKEDCAPPYTANHFQHHLY